MLPLAQDITTTNGGTSGVNAVTLPEFFHLLLLEAGEGWGGGGKRAGGHTVMLGICKCYRLHKISPPQTGGHPV